MEKLGASIRGALEEAPDVRNVFAQRGLDPRGMTPAEFKAVVKSDYDKCGTIIKASGFRIDQ